jgi:signal transduction histidine kinase
MAIICWLCVAQNTTALLIGFAAVFGSNSMANPKNEVMLAFVAGVSHELRTPLAVICSASDNLADGLINDHQQIKRYGSLIKSEGRKLTEMVEQVLEFAGWQSARKPYQLQAVEIDNIINKSLSSIEPQIKDGGFNIEVEIADNLPPVLADDRALCRAIENLLNNAMKYSGESKWIALKAHQAKQAVTITIEDRGLGISSTEQKHIFEPFYRGEAVIAAQIHGNGLGLSLVKKIVAACQGSITVESAPGKGSAFTLHLPVLGRTAEGGNKNLRI